jgi:hypothetical protein
VPAGIVVGYFSPSMSNGLAYQAVGGALRLRDDVPELGFDFSTVTKACTVSLPIRSGRVMKPV